MGKLMFNPSTPDAVINNLTSDSTTDALSAAQGKALNGNLAKKVDIHSVASLGAIELNPNSSTAGHGGFIDFHYNNSSEDYTSRIIESSSGDVEINGISIKGLNSNLSNLNSDSNYTRDILADALTCTGSKFFKGEGSTYTGTVPDSSFKYGIFIVNARGNNVRFVIAQNQGGAIATNAYDGSNWYGWEILTTNSKISSLYYYEGTTDQYECIAIPKANIVYVCAQDVNNVGKIVTPPDQVVTYPSSTVLRFHDVSVGTSLKVWYMIHNS